jgi:hypothetical protein
MRKMISSLQPEVENLARRIALSDRMLTISGTQIGIESSGWEIIVSTSVELRLTRGKFPVSTG